MQSGWRDGILWSVIEAKLSQGNLSREGDSDTSGMFYNCTNRRDGNERAFDVYILLHQLIGGTLTRVAPCVNVVG
jgi:hypothetical protein